MTTWTVVQFPKEDTIEAVPSNWLQDNGTCCWPPYLGETLKNALKKAISVPENETWGIHAVKIYKNSTFDCYVTARQKANKALAKHSEESDLASDSPLSTAGRPVRNSKRRNSSTDEEQDSNRSIPDPPKLRKVVTSKKFDNIMNDHISQEAIQEIISDEDPVILNQYNHENIDVNNIPVYLETTTSSGTNVLLHIQGIPESPSQQNNLSVKKGNSLNVGIANVDHHIASMSSPSTSRSPLSRSPYVSEDSDTTVIACTCCPNHPQKYEYFHQIIRKQNIIQATLMQLVEDINVLKNSRVRDNQNIASIKSIFMELELPAASGIEIDALEQYLAVEENMTNAASEIARIGGDSAEEFVRRILPKLVTDSMLQLYNFLGQKGKKAFSALNVKTLLLNGLQRNLPTSEDSHKKGEKAIVGFLKGAKERAFRQNSK